MRTPFNRSVEDIITEDRERRVLEMRSIAPTHGGARPGAGAKSQVAPETLERWLRLRARGVTLREIAAEAGVHWLTVQRHCRKASLDGGAKEAA